MYLDLYVIYKIRDAKKVIGVSLSDGRIVKREQLLEYGGVEFANAKVSKDGKILAKPGYTIPFVDAETLSFSGRKDTNNV